MSVKHVSSEEFQRELQANKGLILLDFYSEDCAPCAQLAPIYERMAEKYPQVAFFKILRQANRPLAESYGVKGSPTVLFFQDGKLVETPRLNGYVSKPEIRLAIEGLLGISADEAEKEKITADVLILGGGPAGLTSAIYASRSRLKTILIDEGLPGGQAATTYHIANYPGTPGTVHGHELLDNMIAQAKSFGTDIHDLKEVFSVELQGDVKHIVTEDAEYSAPVVILATGAESRRLPVPQEAEFRGNGVHYCATCDGSNYEGADHIIVVGGGNSAVEEAVYLTRYAKQVTIIHQFDHFQASKTAQDEAAANDQIRVIWDSEPRGIIGEKRFTGLEIENVKTHKMSVVEANGAFVYIGMQPRNTLLADQVKLNEWGYVEADDEMRTNVPGVFVAGDVRSKTVRQVATAVGDGAVAAVNAERYLMSRAKRA